MMITGSEQRNASNKLNMLFPSEDKEPLLSAGSCEKHDCEENEPYCDDADEGQYSHVSIL